MFRYAELIRTSYRRLQRLTGLYAYAVNPAVTVSVDYQFIANPAYNAGRGPVSIFAGRLHAEF